jgi:hypothetical protein
MATKQSKPKKLSHKTPKRKRNPCRQPKDDFKGFTTKRLYELVSEPYNPDTGLEVDPDEAYNELCRRLTKKAEKELEIMIREQEAQVAIQQQAAASAPSDEFIDQFTMALLMAQDMVSGPVGLLPVIVSILEDMMPGLNGFTLEAWAGKCYRATLNPLSVEKKPAPVKKEIACLTVVCQSIDDSRFFF